MFPQINLASYLFENSIVQRRLQELENLKGTPTQNADEVINGRRYTGHALDQAQNRGLTTSVVEDAIQNGRGSADPIPGRTRNFSPDNNIRFFSSFKISYLSIGKFHNPAQTPRI